MDKHCKREHCVGIARGENEFCSALCKSLHYTLLRVEQHYHSAATKEFREAMVAQWTALEEAGKWITEYKRLCIVPPGERSS